MSGRAIDEHHRAATNLELFFDLVMVVAVGTAASGLHHALVAGHIASGLTAYCFSFFTIFLAWWNFTWFSSAYDVDDTRYRLTAFVQIVGAILLAVGLSSLYAEEPDMRIGVTGYVLMRLSMVSQWLRAAKEDPERRSTCLKYAVGIADAQLLWCLRMFLPNVTSIIYLSALPIVILEIAIPFIAESKKRIPWHPHHIAERHGLLVIIVLGEGVLGSVNAVASIERTGELMQWLPNVLIMVFATAAVSYALWWHYFHIPFGEILANNRNAAVPFGYLHYFIFASLAAVGTGLEVLADAIAKEWSKELICCSLLTLIIAVAIYFIVIYTMRFFISRTTRCDE